MNVAAQRWQQHTHTHTQAPSQGLSAPGMAQRPGRYLSSSGQPVPTHSLAINEHETSMRHSLPVPRQPGFTLRSPGSEHDLGCYALLAPCQVLNRMLLFVRRVGAVPNQHPVLAPKCLALTLGVILMCGVFFVLF